MPNRDQERAEAFARRLVGTMGQKDQEEPRSQERYPSYMNADEQQAMPTPLFNGVINFHAAFEEARRQPPQAGQGQ